MKTNSRSMSHHLANLVADDGQLLAHLITKIEITKTLILSLPENTLLHRYAEGKWTIKEIISHLVDMERIYACRALRFARNDQSHYPAFDADEYVLFYRQTAEILPALWKNLRQRAMQQLLS